MSHCVKSYKGQTSVARIEDVAQRALDLREMAFELGDPSLIKAIDLMMYCIGKAVARERLAEPTPAPLRRVGGEGSALQAADATPKRRRSVRAQERTVKAA
jgi:hypothetical protein